MNIWNSLRSVSKSAIRKNAISRRKLLVENLESRQLLTVFSIEDKTVDESAGTATITVSVDQITGSGTVNWTTSSGSAAGTVDYASAQGVLTVSQNATQATITVNLTDDTLKESGETFYIVLSSPSVGTIGDGTSVVTIEDDDAVGMTRAIDRFSHGGDVMHSGGATTEYTLPDGTQLSYSSLTYGSSIIDVRTAQPNDSAIPSQIKAELTVNGSLYRTIFYSTSGLTAGAAERFVFDVNGSAWGSGTYNWQLKLTETVGADFSYRTFAGEVDIYDRSGSSFGKGWQINGLDSLVVGTEWVTVLFADGGATHYKKADIQESQFGGVKEGLIQHANGTFTYTSRTRSKTEFSATGRIISRSDANNNTTGYAFDGAGKLTVITRQDGRTITLGYNANARVQSVTDWAGRITTLGYDGSGNLTSITAPDPDGAGGVSAGVTNYTYWAGNSLLKDQTNSLGNSMTFGYDGYNRVSSLTLPGSQVYSFAPQIVQGLVPVGSGTSGSPVALPTSDPFGQVTDPLSRTNSAKFDPLGNPLTVVDALGNSTIYERNNAGYPTKLTLPDPDGVGPKTSPIFLYEYDVENNLTKETQPNASYRTWTYNTIWNKPTQAIDFAGNVTKMTVDSAGNTTTIKQIIGAEDNQFNGETNDILTTLAYSANPTATGQVYGGQVTSVTDGRGYVTNLSYSSTAGNNFARLVGVTLAVGTADEQSTSQTYNAMGLPATATDGMGYVTTFAYDNIGRQLSTTLPDPDGAGALISPVFSTAYNSLGQVTSTTDALGKVTSYTYTARGLIQTVTTPDPDGAGAQTASVMTYNYDNAGRLTSVVDALSKTTSYTYDNADRQIAVTLPDPDGAGALASPVYQTAYDNMGRVISQTDALSRVTAYSYNSLSQLESLTLPDPDGAGALTSPVWQMTYHANGQMNSSTDPLGRITTSTLDALGRTVSKTLPDPDGAGSLASPVIQYAYDKSGNLVSVADPLNAITNFVYDAIGRQTAVTAPDPDGAGPLSAPTRSVVYNDRNQAISSTNEVGAITSFGYDNIGRQKQITQADPDGAGPLTSPIESFVYDANSQMTQYTDPLGKVTSYSFDAMGRVTQLQLPDPDGTGPLTNPTTAFTYDKMNRRLTLTDPTNNTTTWAYDSLGRVTSETNALSKARTYVYDAASQLTKLTDRNSRITEYTYDNLGRNTSEVWKNGTTVVRTMSSTYDAANNLLTAGDASASFVQTYDNLDRLLTTETDYGTGVNKFKVSNVFDASSQRTSASLASKSGAVWTSDLLNSYSYDAVGRINSITQAGQAGGATVASKRADFTYTADSRFASITRYNATTAAPANLVASTTFGYDSLSRLTSLAHNKNSTSIASYGYTFDAMSQISSITATSQVGLAGTSTFSYDATGQLTTTDHTHITDEAYAYDKSGNRTGSGITVGTNNRMTTDGTFNYTYDNEGNLTVRTRISTASANDKTITYTWDHRNRLTSIVYKNNAGAKTKEAIYEYDVFDRRTRKTIDLDGAGSGVAVVSRYVYDGDNILATTNASGAIASRLLHGPAVDQILAVETAGSGSVLWALTDHLGSVRDLVDNSGIVANHIVYDSFGNVASETAATVDFLFGFTGRERDEESGLNYHRARYYSPAIGRWMSEDPIGFNAGDTNLRRYVNNNPVNFTDSSGLVATSVTEVASGEMWPTAAPPTPYTWGKAAFIGGDPANAEDGTLTFNGKAVMSYLGIAKYTPDGALTPEYDAFYKGCFGLLAIRLGRAETQSMPWGVPKTRAFATLEAALEVQQEMLPNTPTDENVVISFYQCAYLNEQLAVHLLPDSQTEYNIEKISSVHTYLETPPRGTFPGFDFGSVHQNADLTVLFYENMPYGGSQNNVTLDVYHRAQLWPTDKAGIVYFVTPIRNHKLIPLSPSGTKSK